MKMDEMREAPEAEKPVPGAWTPIEYAKGMTELSDMKKADVRALYEKANAEIHSLMNANMSLLDRAEFLILSARQNAVEKVIRVLGSMLGEKQEDEAALEEQRVFGTLQKGMMPVLLNDKTNTRIMGICIVKREAKADWKPMGMRDSLVGAPLTNTYEIPGAYMLPEIRNTPTLLPSLIRVIQHKIEKDSTGTGPFYGYFDRPQKVPLSAASVKLFQIKVSPSSVPNASPEKRGFTRYVVKLEKVGNKLVPMPWDNESSPGDKRSS